MVDNVDDITSKQVYEAALAGDQLAVHVIESAGKWLGSAIVSLINLFSTELIVVGGGASAMGDVLLSHVRKYVKKHAYGELGQSTPIIEAQLGNNAGIVGAAGLVINREGL